MTPQERNKYNVARAIARLSACVEYRASLQPWSAKDEAPDTPTKVRQSWRDNAEVIVWNGASEQSLFSPEINVMFRVWHDKTHIDYGLGFSTPDEYRVLLAQQNDYVEFTTKDKDHLDEVDVIALELLRLEIYGQRVYYNKNKDYLENQRDFAKHMLETQHKLYEAWMD